MSSQPYNVSRDSSTNRVWVSCRVLGTDMMKNNGTWKPAIPDQADIKDNFQPVEDSKDAASLYNQAQTALQAIKVVLEQL